VSQSLPLVFAAGSLIKGGPLLAPMPPEGVGAVLATLAIMLFLGPIEEFGWRGVAQPLLQRHFAPLWAGVIIGLVWGVWHLPEFYLAGTLQSDWSFKPFFIGNVVLAVIVTPLFNNAHDRSTLCTSAPAGRHFGARGVCVVKTTLRLRRSPSPPAVEPSPNLRRPPFPNPRFTCAP